MLYTKLTPEFSISLKLLLFSENSHPIILQDKVLTWSWNRRIDNKLKKKDLGFEYIEENKKWFLLIHIVRNNYLLIDSKVSTKMHYNTKHNLKANWSIQVEKPKTGGGNLRFFDRRGVFMNCLLSQFLNKRKLQSLNLDYKFT